MASIKGDQNISVGKAEDTLLDRLIDILIMQIEQEKASELSTPEVD